MRQYSRRSFLRGATALTIASAAPRIAVGLTYVNPDQFPGATFMERCNAMAAQAPLGSHAYLPPGPILQRTPGTDYGILDTGRLSWFSDASEQRPIWYDGSFAGVAKVFKSMPQPPVYAPLNRRFNKLIFSPDNGAIPWNKNATQCNYCSRVMSFEYAAGHGEGKMIMEGCYAPYGTDAAIVFEGLDGNASLYSSILRGNRTDGGLAFRGLGGQPGGIGDSVTILDHRADGKFGVDMSIMAGAGEVVIAGLQGALYGGPALKVRRGNKLKVTGLNIEQQNWDDALFGATRRVIDISMEQAWVPVPGQPPSRLNGLELEGTVSAHSALPFNNVIYIDRALLPKTSRLNLYSPSALTTTMLEFGPNCLYPLLAHPPTFGGQFTNRIVVPESTMPYGYRVGPAWWNTPHWPIVHPVYGPNRAMFLKGLDGTVTLSLEARTDGGPISEGDVICGVPLGMGAAEEVPFNVILDTGVCQGIISPKNAAGNGVVFLERVPPGATRVRGAAVFHSADHHLSGIVTDN